MESGIIGMIDQPNQNKVTGVEAGHAVGTLWCADNGCFSDKWDKAKWWRFLVDNAHRADTCLFAVAPDVVGDAWRTGIRALPYIEPMRALGYRVAWVAQDGQQNHPLPWLGIDALFIGGTTDWKLGPHARALVAEAKRRGKWVHMGRVNSQRRFEYARAIGCDSADGTYLTFGPDTNLPKLLAWTRLNNQPGLWETP
jgi:hypothetical protein